MNETEVRTLVWALMPPVQELITRELAPLREQLRELELLRLSVSNLAREPGPPGPPGADGRSVMVEDLHDVVSDAVTRAVSHAVSTIEIPVPADGRDGRDADPVEIERMIAEKFAALPPVVGAKGEPGEAGSPGLPGRDADPIEIERMISERFAALPLPTAGEKGEPGEAGSPGLPGKDADPIEIERMIAEKFAALPPAKGEQGEPGEIGPQGLPGQDVDHEHIATLVTAEVERQVSALPHPQDGRTPGEEDIAPIVRRVVETALATLPAPAAGPPGEKGEPGERGERGEAGSAGRDGIDGAPGLDGKDVDTVALQGAIERAVEALPKARDGHTPTEDELLPLVERVFSTLPMPKDGLDGRDGKDGADGAGVAAALIDRDGHLVLTLSNGAVYQLGHVVGRDADMDVVLARAAEQIAKLPAPKDGKDGLGIEEVTAERTGDRLITIRFTGADRVREFPIPMPGLMIYRETYKPDSKYEYGDIVTFGGSSWHAQKDTAAKPEDGSPDWRLMTKRGRDGRDGKHGERGIQGPEGRAGRDLTQLGPDGGKW